MGALSVVRTVGAATSGPSADQGILARPHRMNCTRTPSLPPECPDWHDAAQLAEMAKLIASLAPPKSGYLTGAVVAADGGRTAI